MVRKLAEVALVSASMVLSAHAAALNVKDVAVDQHLQSRTLVITGQNFGTRPGTVFVDMRPQEIVMWNDTRIEVLMTPYTKGSRRLLVSKGVGIGHNVLLNVIFKTNQ
ncbi:MAG TPA: hypothetical protein VE621_13410 [Bryobacteraceae bacterium]|nr:hypothetical protein [Bryobacteraceae bacterium]